ncbi:MAG: hypothetical protein U1D55_07415 [Phycisphaerae bacterium]
MLRHLARYRLSFTEIMRYVPCGGDDPEETIRMLKAGGFIGTREGYGGRRVAYVLATRGASAVGAGRRAGEEAGAEAEARHLAVFSFCFLTKKPRARLLKEDLDELFGAAKLAGHEYCLEYSAHRKRVYAVYVPGPSTSPVEIASSVRRRLRDLWQVESLRPWLTNGVLAICATVSDRERAAQVNSRLDEERFEDRPLSDFADVNVEVIPGRDELSEALRVFA